eukprot:TRINITY_DN3211_c0_g1_i1.p1 TRINITY_DN3211_c0_g1~~TRINITY_DN3211_c0_g1_i1.p1  ORF type:complete len:234 (-),score=23.89 TRINITY_DN3211_c0_g1_i1:708-1409(-)
MQVMDWAGIKFDEGPVQGGNFGPYRQSERTEIYRKYSMKLVEGGHAYRCFCSTERLEQLKLNYAKKGLAPTYDRHCLRLTEKQLAENLQNNMPYTIRLKVPEGHTLVNDLVFGNVSYNNNFIDDQVLLKSDGYPTYHLANVVDDHLMEISHVIRGEEWLVSTPKHVILYNAFGWNLPQFAHLPLLLNVDRTKLSKRHGHVSASHYIVVFLFSSSSVLRVDTYLRNKDIFHQLC